MLVFVEGGKPENPEKNPRSEARTNNKLKPQKTTSTGIKPAGHRGGTGASAYPLRQPCSPLIQLPHSCVTHALVGLLASTERSGCFMDSSTRGLTRGHLTADTRSTISIVWEPRAHALGVPRPKQLLMAAGF